MYSAHDMVRNLNMCIYKLHLCYYLRLPGNLGYYYIYIICNIYIYIYVNNYLYLYNIECSY